MVVILIAPLVFLLVAGLLTWLDHVLDERLAAEMRDEGWVL